MYLSQFQLSSIEWYRYFDDEDQTGDHKWKEVKRNFHTKLYRSQHCTRQCSMERLITHYVSHDCRWFKSLSLFDAITCMDGVDYIQADVLNFST